MSLLFLRGSGLSSHSSLIPGQRLPRALGSLVWGGSKNQGCRKWAGPVQLHLCELMRANNAFLVSLRHWAAKVGNPSVGCFPHLRPYPFSNVHQFGPRVPLGQLPEPRG